MDEYALDIDHILAEEESIPSTFAIRSTNLGYLDPSSGEDDLPANSKIDLPLWLARDLYEKNMVIPELPRHFSHKFREEIWAGPGSVNLRSQSKYYYLTGKHLSDMMGDEELKKVLCHAASGERHTSILDWSLSRFLTCHFLLLFYVVLLLDLVHKEM